MKVLSMHKGFVKVFFAAIPILIILSYSADVFTPSLYNKMALMDADLDSQIDYRSGSSFFKQILWLFIFFYGLSVSFFCKRLSIRMIILPIVITLVYLFVTSFFSDYFFITAKRSFFQFLLVFSVYFCFLNIESKRHLQNILFLFFCFLLVYEIAFIVFFNEYAFNQNGELTGIHKGKNAFGYVAFFGLFVSYEYYKKISKCWWILFCCLFWMVFLILSFSKTCLLLFLIVFLFKYYVGIINLKLFLLFFIKLMVVFYLGIPVVSFLLEGDVLKLLAPIFESIDLTGRGEIWLLSYDSLIGNSVFGFGYGAFWGVERLPENFDVPFSYLQYLNQSHNGYIDCILQLGLLGAALLVGVWYFYYMRVTVALDKFWLSIILFAFLHNLTESSLLRDAHLVWVFLLMAVFSNLLNKGSGHEHQ